MSFPRRWESSLTISWIPFYKGDKGQVCHSHASLSSQAAAGIQNKYLLDPLFQGDDKRGGLSFPRFFVIPSCGGNPE
ncbi:MAG: hypothetical protein SFT68_05965 [Rickettsiaceae bacterium]|nr:hypothetical protein [Rickettsiaceae bacterium]